MQNLIYKIKYLLFLSWDWEAWCLTVWGVIPPPERNTAWHKGRKCFHCLGAPNNLIRPWVAVSSVSVAISARRLKTHYDLSKRLRLNTRQSIHNQNLKLQLFIIIKSTTHSTPMTAANTSRSLAEWSPCRMGNNSRILRYNWLECLR